MRCHLRLFYALSILFGIDDDDDDADTGDDICFPFPKEKKNSQCKR